LIDRLNYVKRKEEPTELKVRQPALPSFDLEKETFAAPTPTLFDCVNECSTDGLWLLFE